MAKKVLSAKPANFFWYVFLLGEDGGSNKRRLKCLDRLVLIDNKPSWKSDLKLWLAHSEHLIDRPHGPNKNKPPCRVLENGINQFCYCRNWEKLKLFWPKTSKWPYSEAWMLKGWHSKAAQSQPQSWPQKISNFV